MQSSFVLNPKRNFLVFSLFVLISCSKKPISNNDMQDNNKLKFDDPHSYANLGKVVTKHAHLDLKVDFVSRILQGTCTWTFEKLTEVDSLILDTRDLQISQVTLTDGTPCFFSLGKNHPTFGQALSIGIPKDANQVVIHYKTSPQAAALQWLSPDQTDGKDPFLFSQSQAILARSWVPCQDAPGVKFTYDAKITCPPNLMALMSATKKKKKNETGIYHFKMEQAISSYLLALAVGNVEFQRTGRNSGVYAEPSMLEKSVAEFEDMQQMIDSAEALYGPYKWERYDVLVLPPSFPFGGMENPRLTFATPTIIAGDKSLVALIAHELAHSWSGNLVTNKTWNDFWLNEGFTVYFEQRIMEKIYGTEYERMLTTLGFGELQNTVQRLNRAGKRKDTHLYLNLEGRDPDEGLTDVAYEKGRFFLQTIESVVGRKKFDDFLTQYFSENAFEPMSTEEFLRYLDAHLLDTIEGAKDSIKPHMWVYGPGIPGNIPPVQSAALDTIDKILQNFNQGKALSEKQTKAWTTHHWLYFLRGIQTEKMTMVRMEALDSTFGLTQGSNAEILCDWFKIAIEKEYKKAYPAIKKFLMSVGRRKFLTPLYERLAKTEEGKDWAKEVFAKARPGYHAVSYQSIEEILE